MFTAALGGGAELTPLRRMKIAEAAPAQGPRRLTRLPTSRA
jgi:hypothetical protein